ncbi:MAG: YebC/PmpR family DNA-binding transcriptional regulator [Candidatus Pacebacteria bacterium CG10_big_fil_rev_8_21_14_0_10_56_10]|nr:MAG: YebC/PmpR family DNA-binding transcriptional regulator [Candidatus Pacebacteria bacterium CG10_big_fil_rev_8_21_14_0_10_56_10]
MAGHSKWANIKHRKGAMDAKRGRVFSHLSRAVRMAVKDGGSGDPKSNPTLRTLIDKARAANMPKDNIQKAINKGLGKSGSGVQFQEVTYEGYGPGGVGLLVEVVTDNTNRAGADVKSLFSKAGGSLGSPGSVSYLFERRGNDYQLKMPMPLPDDASLSRLRQLVDEIEELDDVEAVYTGVEMPDEGGEANWA